MTITSNFEDSMLVENSLLKQADGARDSRDWAKAADLYQSYVERRPKEWRIWVQLGHMRKEAGAYDAAQIAYEEASKLAPDDADLALQLGHLMKLQKQKGKAIEHYRRSLELDSTNGEAYRELALLGAQDIAERIIQRSGTSNTKTWLDVTDLIFYVRHHARVTGIQRVQAGILSQLLLDEHDFGCAYITESGALLEISSDSVIGLMQLLAQTNIRVDDLKNFTDQIVADGRPFDMSRSSVYVLLGAFWIRAHVVSRTIRQLKSRGWAIAVYIYDLIPIRNPEYCEIELTRHFGASLFALMPMVDLFMTISQFVADELIETLREIGLSTPVVPVLLAHRSWESEPLSKAEAAEWLAEEGLDSPFVLCVGTIEIRKNHALLFNIWRTMHREHKDIPKLVLVGRPGWRVSDTMKALEASGYINGKVVILNDLSDRQVATLYENCIFTVFPSFVEGWGLPVGESLAFGKACAASKASSIPEVGGDFVTYFDPFNIRDAQGVIETMIANSSLVAAAEEKINSLFKVRGWFEVAGTIKDTLSQIAVSGGAAEPFAPALIEGQFYEFGWNRINASKLQSFIDQVFVLAFGCDWHTIEEFGVWARRKRARIDFKTSAAPGEKVVVYLRLVAPPSIPDGKVSISGIGKSRDPVSNLFAFTSHQRMLSTELIADAHGTVSFVITTEGTPQPLPNDSRELYVGVSGLSYVRADNFGGRLAAIERAVFG